MNVLIVGGGGREHALAKAISTSIKCTRLYAAPGNPGISKFATCIELSSENKKMLYIPEGFAHGYLVMSEKSIVSYKCTNLYNPNDEYGIKWNDKTIDIDWGNNSPIISKKDDNLLSLKFQKLLPKY